MKIISSTNLRNNYCKIIDDCTILDDECSHIERELIRIEAEDDVGKTEYIALEDFEKHLDSRI